MTASIRGTHQQLRIAGNGLQRGFQFVGHIGGKLLFLFFQLALFFIIGLDLLHKGAQLFFGLYPVNVVDVFAQLFQRLNNCASDGVADRHGSPQHRR